MNVQYWTKALRQAERDFDAATRRSDIDAAARRLMRARAELRLLEKASKAKARRTVTADPSPPDPAP